MQYNLSISREVIQLLSNKKLSLDQLFFLELIQKENLDFLNKLLDNIQYKQFVVHDLLNKKMILVSGNTFKLTDESRQLLSLYDFISGDDSGFIAQSDELEIDRPIKVLISDDFDEKFNELWNLYPLTDKWEMDGVYGSNYYRHLHPHSRTLKGAKLKIKEKYRILLKDKKNNLPHQDIINSLKYELWFRKLNSTNIKNGLSYMQNILTWINQKTFESYFELYQEHIKEYGSINFNSTGTGAGNYNGRVIMGAGVSTRLV